MGAFLMSTKLVTSIQKGSNSFETGKKAAQEANTKLMGNSASLCILYGSPDYDLREVLNGVQSVIGKEIQVIGCSSCGNFTEEKVDHKSVAIGLISTDQYRFKVVGETGIKEKIGIDFFKKIHAKLNNFISEEGETTLIMIVDGLAGNGEEVTIATQTVFETELNIIGGAAGDDLAFKETKVIYNDNIETNAVSICAVKGPSSFFSSVKHGHTPLSDVKQITKAEGGRLYTVDNRPAWDVWKDATRKRCKQIGIDVDKLSSPGDIGAFLIRFELGLESSKGYKIRVPLSKNDDGSLNFACAIPSGVKIKIMESVPEAQIKSAREAAEIAKKSIGAVKIGGALIFDCVCRSIILGERFQEGVAAIKDVIGDVPLIGFETYGEICMNPSQFSGFHNTTTVIALIPA